MEVEIRRAQLSAAHIAVSVRDAETGATLVSLSDRDLMIPASNMKLLTTGAALPRWLRHGSSVSRWL